VVLRPDLDTTLSRGCRARARGDNVLTDTDAIIGMYGAFARLEGFEGHVIDTGDLDAEQTAAAAGVSLPRGSTGSSRAGDLRIPSIR
jgi:hypothetical protein